MSVMRSKPRDQGASVPQATPVINITQAGQFTSHLEYEVLDHSELPTLQMSGNEKCATINNLMTQYAIPLHPGLTGANKLDRLAVSYSWIEFVGEIVVHYRPLTPLTATGVVRARVVHQRSLSDLSKDTALWDDSYGTALANPAAKDFRVRVPLAAMGPGAHVAPLASQVCSWVLIWTTGCEKLEGELWLKYNVRAGGAGIAATPAKSFRVVNGVFEDNQAETRNGTRPLLPGLPAAGRITGYHFTGSDGPGMTTAQFRDFVQLSGGTPLQVVRAPADTPVLRPGSDRVTYALMHFGDQVLQRTLDTATRVGLSAYDGLLAKFGKWLVGLGEAVRQGENPDASHAFANFSGAVTVTPLDSYALWVNRQPSIPVLVKKAPADQTQEVSPELRFLGALAPMFADALANALLALTAGEVAGALYTAYLAIKGPKSVVHKGQHARAWAMPLFEFGPGENPGGGTEGLPELPDFDNDAEAPGTLVDWRGTQQYYQLYITNDGGVPKVHFSTASRIYKSLSVEAYFFGPPTPMWYEDHRFPWDRETKRYTACVIDVDPKLDGHYLCLEGFTWGDNAACVWSPNAAGASYYGSCARYSGITCSRSVVRVNNYSQFNSKPSLLLGPSKMKYRAADAGPTFLGVVRVAATSSAEVASAFLQNYAADPSVKTMTNIGHEQAMTTLATHADFKRSRAEPNIDLDIFSPSFAGDRAARADYPTIDAGPVRVALMARWDNANGWWQHVPDCYVTQTARGSRWSATCKMDASLFKASDATKVPSTCVMTVSIPSQWRSDKTAWCIEAVSLAGSSCALPLVLTSSTGASLLDVHANWKPMCRSLSGPLCTSRWVLPGSAGTAYVCIRGDTSRPAMAVEGYKDDIYAVASLTMYCLASKKAAFEWGDFKSFDYDQGNDPANRATKWFSLAASHCKPGKPYWDYTDQTVSQHVVGTEETSQTWDKSPCVSPQAGWLETPYSGFNGSRSVGTRPFRPSASRGTDSTDGFGGSISPPEPDAPDEPDLPDPEQPPQDPEPELEYPDLVEVRPDNKVHLSPSLPGSPDELNDSYALTRWTTMWTNNRKETVAEHIRKVNCILDYHDMRGQLPYSLDVLGQTFGTGDRSADVAQMPYAVPAMPAQRPCPPLNIYIVFNCGKVTWNYGKNPAVLTTTGDFAGLELFTSGGGTANETIGASGSYLLHTGRAVMPLGHSQAFRLRRMQIFTSRVLDQAEDVTNGCEIMRAYNRNNTVMLAYSVDMADPNGVHSAVQHAFMGLRHAGHMRLGYPAEQGWVLTTFLPYQEGLEVAKARCPELLEFRGRFQSPCNNTTTYLEEEPKALLGPVWEGNEEPLPRDSPEPSEPQEEEQTIA